MRLGRVTKANAVRGSRASTRKLWTFAVLRQDRRSRRLQPSAGLVRRPCVSSGFEVWRGPSFASGSTLQHVRYGSLADIRERIRDVRFSPKSRHSHRRHQCLLSANSRPSLGRAKRRYVSCKPDCTRSREKRSMTAGSRKECPSRQACNVIAGLIFIIFPTSTRASAERPRRT